MLAAPGRAWIAAVALFEALSIWGFFLQHIFPLLAAVVVLACLLTMLALFFRDPDRAPAGGIVAAADGRVMVVEREGDRIRIGTFMNVTNVHVNRTPFPGYLVRVDVREGPRHPAFSPKATGNAQKRYVCGTPIGLIEVVQITGLIARRCVSYLEEGAPMKKGEKFGMVLFGSRVDVVLPAHRVKVLVRVGDAVHAGTTSLAELAG